MRISTLLFGSACVIFLTLGISLSGEGPAQDNAAFVLIFAGLWCGLMTGLSVMGRDK